MNTKQNPFTQVSHLLFCLFKPLKYCANLKIEHGVGGALQEMDMEAQV